MGVVGTPRHRLPGAGSLALAGGEGGPDTRLIITVKECCPRKESSPLPASPASQPGPGSA